MFLLKVVFIHLLAFVFGTSALFEELRSGSELEFGTWHPLARCPDGSFANAFEVAAKDEVNKLFTDELAMTGMRLYCSQGVNQTDSIITSFVLEDAGSWRGKSACPAGEWIIGYRLRVANYMGVTKDDTATNDANVICTSGLALAGKGNVRGDWQQWANCSAGNAVCGLATKIDDAKISFDKAGLVTVHLRCCPLNPNINESEAMELKSNEQAMHSVPETSTQKGDEHVKSTEAFKTDIHSSELPKANLGEIPSNQTIDAKHTEDKKSQDVPKPRNDLLSHESKHDENPASPVDNPIPQPNFNINPVSPVPDANHGSKPDANHGSKPDANHGSKPDENFISKSDSKLPMINPIKFPV